jgi:hypothetical protein
MNTDEYEDELRRRAATRETIHKVLGFAALVVLCLVVGVLKLYADAWYFSALSQWSTP